MDGFSYTSTLFEGQVAVVTGAGSMLGIGRSICLALAAGGAAIIYATDLNSGNFAALQEQAHGINPKCQLFGHVLDVCSEEETIDLLKEITQKHGRLDVFFANAGYVEVKNINDISRVQVDRSLDVMTKAVYYAVKHSSAAMMVTGPGKCASGGSIVVTASVAGVNGKYADLAYCTAKAAAIGMVRSAAVQLSKSNIRVNAVAPGPVVTSLLSTSRYAKLGEKVNLKSTKEDAAADYHEYRQIKGLEPESEYSFERIALPEEIANIAIFLASRISSAINGQAISADCGLTEGVMAPTFMGGIPVRNALTVGQ